MILLLVVVQNNLYSKFNIKFYGNKLFYSIHRVQNVAFQKIKS